MLPAGRASRAPVPRSWSLVAPRNLGEEFAGTRIPSEQEGTGTGTGKNQLLTITNIAFLTPGWEAPANNTNLPFLWTQFSEEREDIVGYF